MNETIMLIAVASTAFGAILSTLKGYFGTQEPYKVNRLISSLIISIMVSLSIVNFNVIQDNLTSVGLVGLIVLQLVLGFGTDQGLSKLDK